MQEILTAFGIDWRLIVIQVFNFAMLAYVLWYFLYTPVLKLLAEREENVRAVALVRRPPALSNDMAVPHKHKAVHITNFVVGVV